MTELEAIKEIKRWTNILMSAGNKCVSETAEAQDMAIKALGEIQNYKKIGTPEEFRAAVEKQKAKKPIEPDEEYGTFKCPNCGGLIFTENRFETHKHCLLCGQKLDWSDEDDT